MLKDLINPTPEEVEKAEGLARHWASLRNVVPADRKDMIGKWYLEDILGLSGAISKEFRTMCSRGQNPKTDASLLYIKVGSTQFIHRPERSGITNFWRKILTVCPGFIDNRDELEFLITKGHGSLPRALLNSLQPEDNSLLEEFSSPVLRGIQVSIDILQEAR